jgi:hypothetical protein
MRRLPIGVSGALRCCIRASEKVVRFYTHSLSAGPDLSSPRSERPRARHQGAVTAHEPKLKKVPPAAAFARTAAP